MINLWNRINLIERFYIGRIFAVSMMSLVLILTVFQINTMAQASNIENNESNEDIQNDIAENQSVSVTITADGDTFSTKVPEGMTVDTLLSQHGIQYDMYDMIQPAPDEAVNHGDRIVLQRVEYEEYTVNETLPHETVIKHTSLLEKGKMKKIYEGYDGLVKRTFAQYTVDGMQEEAQLTGEKITKHPSTEMILIGDSQPVSPFDFDVEFDENGKPLNYKQVFHNQVATGYSAGQGAKTASGRYAIPGHVAVRSDMIPYGSKLYIATADNSFIYGYAISADTGEGLMANVIDVDLFYETYQESVLNGRRIVDIYVLE